MSKSLVRVPHSAPFDAKAAVEAVAIAAGRTEAMIVSLRRELNRAPWEDADPNPKPGCVSRVSTMDALIDGAEDAARKVRNTLGMIALRMGKHG